MTLAPILEAAERVSRPDAYPDDSRIITDVGEAVRTLRDFALAAIPVIEALPVGHGTLETQPLIHAINGLLDRINERQFPSYLTLQGHDQYLIVKALQSYAALAAIEGE